MHHLGIIAENINGRCTQFVSVILNCKCICVIPKEASSKRNSIPDLEDFLSDFPIHQITRSLNESL